MKVGGVALNALAWARRRAIRSSGLRTSYTAARRWSWCSVPER